MSYTSLVLLKAKQELLEAWEWYENRQPGLGDRFRKELYKRLHQIEQNPEQYPLRKRLYREAQIAIFPYLIIYRIKKREKLIVIISIFHMSRHPKKKFRK